MACVRIVVKEVQSKDKKKTFKTYKVVDEDNKGKLVDCVMCKSVAPEMKAKLDDCVKAEINGDISINNTGYEFPKAFIRSIESVEKIR